MIRVVVLLLILGFLCNNKVFGADSYKYIPYIPVIPTKSYTDAKESQIERRREKISSYYGIGLKGTTVYSYISSSVFDIKRGIDAGVYVSNEVYFYYLFSFELDFGYKVSTFNSDKYFYKIKYFSLPLLLKYYYSRHFLDPKILEFFVGLGFEYRLKVGEEGFGDAVRAQNESLGVLLSLGLKMNVYKGIGFVLEGRFYTDLKSVIVTDRGELGYLREIDLLIGVVYDF